MRFDSQSVDWFTENLGTIKDEVTRGAIWRYFWMLVQDRQITSYKYLELAKKNLVLETVEQIISVVLMHLSAAIGYLPVESIKEKRSDLFEALYKMIQSENENIPKDAIVD